MVPSATYWKGRLKAKLRHGRIQVMGASFFLYFFSPVPVGFSEGYERIQAKKNKGSSLRLTFDQVSFNLLHPCPQLFVLCA
jgi:hypothetical protein